MKIYHMMRGRQRAPQAILLSTFICLSAVSLSGCSEKNVEKPVARVQVLETYPVKTKFLDRDMTLPAEVLPYQDVPIYPKVSGFIKWIGVDRGSEVKKGQLLVTLVAPEMAAQRDEAEAKRLEAVQVLQESQRRLQSEQSLVSQSQAKLDAARLTSDRLAEAAKTPGAIAQNEVDVQKKLVEADEQLVKYHAEMVKAAQAQTQTAKARIAAAEKTVANFKDWNAYLQVTAPFDGVITERNMHEGSFAYPPSGSNGYPPMLRLKQNDLLRIVVPVPEIAVSDLRIGRNIPFTVAAFPSRVFQGSVARLAHSLDQATRTMPVELNYPNTDGLIAPGMFPEVHWPMKRPYQTLFVPVSAVAVTLQQPFVIKVTNGRAQWVNVKRGQVMGNMVEIFPKVADSLAENDVVAINASDEIVDGSPCETKPATDKDIDGTAKPAQEPPVPITPGEQPGAN